MPSNKIFKITWSLLFLAGALVSCSKNFLDVKPKGKVIASATTDYNNLLEDDIFNRLTGAGNFLNAQHILGDDVAGLEPHYSAEKNFGAPGTRPHNLFQWADDVYRPDENTFEVAGLYNRLYTINKIIDEVMGSTGSNQQLKEQVRAEALAQRAFAYFMLVNYFAKPYVEATATTDPAVPIITKSTFGAEPFTRASVKAVYDMMVEDLKSAIPDLPLIQNSANRFSKSAGETLLGKIFLFMGKPADAVPYLDDAVSHLPSKFAISGNIGMMNYNTATVNNPVVGFIFTVPGMIATAAQGHGHPEVLNAQCAAVTWLGGHAGLIIDPATRDLYGPNDKRLLLYSNAYGITIPGPGPLLPTGLYRIRAGFLGNSIGISLPDIYLLRAEALARTGEAGKATESLLTVRTNRMPQADAEADIPTDKDELVKFIIEERRREFAGLGFRWFDMRRLSVDPLFAGQQQFTHTVYNADGTVKATYQLKPERLVMRFGQALVAQTPGFTNNP
ncbi:RagB/SusD family nutrient uptake outer membrane protein [Pseudoflavitalea rhizosphaerae]|uniref:RagB/SusD family nutrient uptake outer membrane protein n=1 Tax=Pseudoflavitalea rhizosphaerae TaxID=1884793 RepID=UPI000F8D3E9D|nr:RagB/SusD family nutrient uptake outer membrane protein [Pseudoflavitalea rhizosphaerae]